MHHNDMLYIRKLIFLSYAILSIHAFSESIASNRVTPISVLDLDWDKWYREHTVSLPQKWEKDAQGYKIKGTVGNNQSLSRVKRSAGPFEDESTHVVCPPLSSFAIITYNDLQCPKLLEAQENKYTPLKQLRMLDSSKLMAVAEVCTCIQKKYKRYCFKRFFDSDYKEESDITLEPSLEHCTTLCEEMLTAGNVKLIHGKMPEFQCHWMDGTTTDGIVTTVHKIRVKYNLISKGITNQFINQGSCIWGDPKCKFQGGANVVFPVKALPKIDPLSSRNQLITELEGRYADHKNKFAIVRTKVTRTLHTMRTCCFYYEKHCLKTSVRGVWFVELVVPKNAIACPPQSTQVAPPLAIEGIQEESVEQLLLKEHVCYLTKQAILNSVEIGVPVNKHLLSVFNNDNKNKKEVDQYYLSNKALIRARCINVAYHTIERHCHDIWTLRYQSSIVGCYDARANVAFTGLCECYNETQSYMILGKHIVHESNGSYTLSQYDYPESEQIEELTLLAKGYKELVSFLETPTGAIIYENPQLKAQERDNMMTQDKKSWNFLGWIGRWVSKIQTVLITVAVITCCIIGIVIFIKCYARVKLTSFAYQRLSNPGENAQRFKAGYDELKDRVTSRVKRYKSPV